MPLIPLKLPGNKKTDVTDTPIDGDGLVFSSAKDLWDSQPGGGGGEANTSSNSGAGDGWALAKVGVDLPFKSLITTAPIATTVNANDLTITLNGLVNADLSGSAAITFANLQNIATARLLGRQTAASGVIEEISLNSTLELVAATTLQRAALTGDVTASAGSNALTYNPLSIVNADISATAAIVETKFSVAVGASTTVLTSNGVGVAPTYQAPAGGEFTAAWTANHNQTGSTFSLEDARFADPTDDTKTVQWNLSGNTGGVELTMATTQSTAQTLTYPNIIAGDTLVTLGLAQAITGQKTFTAPILGIPASGDLQNCTALPTTSLTGIIPDARMPNLTGDVTTVEGAVATTVTNVPAGAYAALSIVNGDISASAAIVLTKIQDIATDRLLGRETAASGAIEELTIDATLTLGSTQLSRTAITGDITIAAGSNASVFAANVIVDADISASAEIAVSKLADGTAFQRIRTDSAGTGVEYFTEEAGISFIIDGGGSTITTGVKGDLEIPFACTINRATLFADQTGSIVIDIFKDTFANFPPVVGDSITASAKPTISSGVKDEDDTLTGWTTQINAGDILRFNVDSVTTIQRLTVTLSVNKEG